MSMDHCWYDTDRRNRSTSRTALLSKTSRTWIFTELNPDFCGERKSTNILEYFKYGDNCIMCVCVLYIHIIYIYIYILPVTFI